MLSEDSDLRDRIAEILETVAKDGVTDVAIDAIFDAFEVALGDVLK